MNRPLFAVGEIVVLQSVDCPHLNGERAVLRVIASGEIYTCPLSGRKVRRVSKGFGYLLEGCGVENMRGLVRQWTESALRKRHQPGEYSFDALKQVLAMPVSRGDFA